MQGLETRRKEDRLNKLGELRGRGFSGFPAPPLHDAPPQNPRFLLSHALSLPPGVAGGPVSIRVCSGISLEEDLGHLMVAWMKRRLTWHLGAVCTVSPLFPK